MLLLESVRMSVLSLHTLYSYTSSIDPPLNLAFDDPFFCVRALSSTPPYKIVRQLEVVLETFLLRPSVPSPSSRISHVHDGLRSIRHSGLGGAVNTLTRWQERNRERRWIGFIIVL